VCTTMEVVIAENYRFSPRLCSDDSKEHSSKPSDTLPCGISVHQNRHILSASVELDGVEKHDKYVDNTPEQFGAALTSQNSLLAELSAVSGKVVTLTLPSDSCTDATAIVNCMAEDSQSTCTNDCSLSVSAVTAKLADCDVSTTDHSIELTEPQCVVRPKSLCNAKKSVCFPIDDTDNSSANQSATDEKQDSKRMSLLLRLFESKLFDMAIALPYLFNSKEPGVLAYLGLCFFVCSVI